MTSSFNQEIGYHARSKFFGAFAGLCLAISTVWGSEAFAAQKNNVKIEGAAEAPLPEAPSLARDLPPRQVEIIIVWGFRLRTTEHDLRMASIRDGYGELVDKSACVTAVCGFVVVQDGAKWRNTNVIAASETELRDMQHNMEREGTTLVIVHPTGTKRTIPNF
jgi:hypothetical protein